MITIKKFVFNDIQVNTYVLFDETKQCVIIDPGCFTADEKQELIEFVSVNKLTPVKAIITHGHIDHVLGLNFVSDHFKIPVEAHVESLPFIKDAKQHALLYGFEIDPVKEPSVFIKEGDSIDFGKSKLEILYTPGHADGSICLFCREKKFVIVGDVLFNESVGRTDLPTGDFDILAESITSKLYTLPDDVIVYPGHGPETIIGYEKKNNPFITG